MNTTTTQWPLGMAAPKKHAGWWMAALKKTGRMATGQNPRGCDGARQRQCKHNRGQCCYGSLNYEKKLDTAASRPLSKKKSPDGGRPAVPKHWLHGGWLIPFRPRAGMAVSAGNRALFFLWKLDKAGSGLVVLPIGRSTNFPARVICNYSMVKINTSDSFSSNGNVHAARLHRSERPLR